MSTTLYLSPSTWDLAVDSTGSIALAGAPYQLAQDAASAIRTFEGEVYYDTTEGVPYFAEILGRQPSVALLKARFQEAALTAQDVASADVVITSMDGRTVSGQVIVSDHAGATASASF